MERNEDPAPSGDAEATEGWEDWLRDLRTEVPPDQFSWSDPADEKPAAAAPDEVPRGGRHRAED
jgi:hypothetical protein